MKSGVKGFWKKQKNVIRRHKPSTIVTHCPDVCLDFSKIDTSFRKLENVFFTSNVRSDSDKSYNVLLSEHFGGKVDK